MNVQRICFACFYFEYDYFVTRCVNLLVLITACVMIKLQSAKHGISFLQQKGSEPHSQCLKKDLRLNQRSTITIKLRQYIPFKDSRLLAVGFLTAFMHILQKEGCQAEATPNSGFKFDDDSSSIFLVVRAHVRIFHLISRRGRCR